MSHFGFFLREKIVDGPPNKTGLIK